jgi:hypothetical protein
MSSVVPMSWGRLFSSEWSDCSRTVLPWLRLWMMTLTRFKSKSSSLCSWLVWRGFFEFPVGDLRGGVIA